MRRECRERSPRHQLQRKPPVSDPAMHHGTCVPHVVHVGIANPWWWGKRSRHARYMRSPQFYVSDKRPMLIAHLSSVSNGVRETNCKAKYRYGCPYVIRWYRRDQIRFITRNDGRLFQVCYFFRGNGIKVGFGLWNTRWLLFFFLKVIYYVRN